MKTLFEYNNLDGSGAFIVIEVVGWKTIKKDVEAFYAIETKSGFIHNLSAEEFGSFKAIFHNLVGR